MKSRIHLGRAKRLHSQASRLVARGDYPAADAAFRRAIREANRAGGLDPLFLAAMLNDFGVLCKASGRFAAAERAYRRAMRLIASSRRNPGYKDALATLYHNLGGIAHARGRYGEGLRYARRGIAIRKAIRPRDTLALAADEAALAAILADAGRMADAAKLYLRALRTFRRILGARHCEVGSTLSGLGSLYARTARPNEAERALRLGVTIMEDALGKRHPRIATALNNLAVVCARGGKFREARALYHRVQRMSEIQPRSVPIAALARQNYKKLRRAEAGAAGRASGEIFNRR